MPQLLLYGRICSIYYCHLGAVLRTVDRGSGRFPGEMNAHQPPWAKLPPTKAARNDGLLVKFILVQGRLFRAVFPSARARGLVLPQADFPGVRDSRNDMSPPLRLVCSVRAERGSFGSSWGPRD